MKPLRPPRLLLPALALLAALGALAGLLAGRPVEAAIDNNQPDQAYAAYNVDCIRNGVDFGLQTHQSPRFAATCYGTAWERESYEFDSISPMGDAPRTNPAVIGFGDGRPDGPGEPGHLTLASLGTNGTADGGLGLGAVYGLAYSSGRNPAAPAFARIDRTFVGAFTKRITRFGMGGPGAIYVLLPNGDEQVYVTVPDVVPGPNGLPGDPGDGSAALFPNEVFAIPYNNAMGGVHSFDHDDAARPLIARSSLGDLELTLDERYLVALNLNTKSLYRYDTWSASPQSSQAAFAVPAASAACPGGELNFRPFGLDYNGSDGSLLVGYVCSAESTQDRNDLRAGVLQLSPMGAWSRVLDFPLAPFDSQRIEAPYNYAWQPWSDSFSNEQPIIADLEITEQGDLVIGLRDRTGDIGGTALSGEFGVANGDLLLAPANGAGGWNAPNPGGAEFFSPDLGYNNDYRESNWGSLAYLPGQHDGSFGGELISTAGFPYRAETGGAAWFNAGSGQRTAREELYDAGPTTLAKAAGLGDVELLCTWRAIGNRVWRDNNANGLQDAGEPSIAGVRLQLLDPSSGALLATLTTGNLGAADDTWRFYLPPWQAFVVRIDPAMFNPGQPLAGLGLTTANAGGNDLLDSDADPQGRINIPAANHSNVDLSFDAGLVQTANITVDKNGPATANAGQQIDYTLTVTNQGPAVAQNIQVVDTLPPNVSLVSSSPPPSSQSGATLTWNLGSLNAGAGATITVRVQVAAGFSGTLTNQVNVTTATPGDDPGDNSDTVVTTVNAPNLALSKSCPPTVAVGEHVTYTIDYRNTGSGSFSTVTMVDTLPTGMSVVSISPFGVIAGNQVTWGTVDLAPGAGGTLTLVARAEAATVNSNVTNRIDLGVSSPADSAGADNSATCTTLVQGAEVQIAKNGPATVLPGEQFVYTLIASNPGPIVAHNVQVSDTLPPGVGFAGATPAQSSISGATVTWDLGMLNPGQQVGITVQAVAAGGLARGTQLVNTAQITTSTPGDNPANNTATATTTVITPNVFVQKDGPAIAVAGDQVTYTLFYGNNGNAPAAGTQLVDTLPAGLSFVSASPAPASVSGQTLTWDLGSLPSGDSGSITVMAQVDSGLANGVTVTNQATIATGTPGDEPADNSATALTTVQRADVRITKSSPTGFPVYSGQSVTYYLDFTNGGPAAAANVQISDTVPAQLSGVSWSCTSGCSGSGTGNQISVSIASLAAGGSGRITLTGTATTAGGREDFVNTTRIDTDTPETDLTNNQSSIPGAVWTADLQIIKTADAQVVAGDSFTATLTYRNNGPAPALNVILSDTLPAGVTLVSSLPAPSSQSGQTVSWALGALADQAGGSIALTLQADNALAAGAGLVNQAHIATGSPDRDPRNDQDEATTMVVTRADLGISKNGPVQVTAGSNIVYSLNYHNDGPSIARSVVVTDTLPAGMTFVNAHPSPTSHAGGVLVWEVGDLSPNGGGTITVLVQTSASQSQPSETLTNTAVIAAPTADPDASNNAGSATTSVETADLLVLKTATPDHVRAGDMLTYTLVIANDGPAVAHNVVLTDTLPEGVSLISASPAATEQNGRLIGWNVGLLNSDERRSYTVSVLIERSLAPGTLINRAEGQTTTPDRNLANNHTQVNTPLQQPDLRIRKDDGLLEVQAGDTVTYTLTVENVGPAAAHQVVITETAPLSVTVLSGDWSFQGDQHWNYGLGTLAAGEQRSITFVVRLPNPFDAATIRNLVTVSDDGSAGPDPTPEDNSAEDLDRVLSGTIGDRIWFDNNQDGIQDPDEAGVEGVLVQLLDAATLTLIDETISGPDGVYLFSGFRMGEYAVQIATTALQSGAYAGYRVTGDPLPRTVLTPAQPSDLRLDIGLADPAATDITLASLSVHRQAAGTVQMKWRTVAERNNAGFRILRATVPEVGQAVQIGYVRSQGSQGGEYQFIDNEQLGQPAFYWLVAVEFGGREDQYGPLSPIPMLNDEVRRTIYLPMLIG